MGVISVMAAARLPPHPPLPVHFTAFKVTNRMEKRPFLILVKRQAADVKTLISNDRMHFKLQLLRDARCTLTGFDSANGTVNTQQTGQSSGRVQALGVSRGQHSPSANTL